MNMPASRAAYVLLCLRKKIVLFTILSLSATYCLYSFTMKHNFLESGVRTKSAFVKSFQDNKLFRWNPNPTETDEMALPTDCRNSVQGRDLIADDLGYVCHPMDVLANGCCSTNVKSRKRYVCDTCLSNNCCEIYEHCLSCCLNPDKRSLLENVIKKMSSRFQFILSGTKDQYELCTAKCRTNSKSVYRGNMYRDPDLRYCFGELPESNGTIST